MPKKERYETLDHLVDQTQIVDQGAGSGLDADTVDGEHAAAFADAVHTHVEADITDLSHDAVKIQTRDVLATAPSSGDVLAWNGSAWAPLTGPAPGAHTHVEADITDLERHQLTLTGTDPRLRLDDTDGGSDWDFFNVAGVLHIEPTGDALMGIEIATDGTITFGRVTASGTLIELVDSTGVLEWTISSASNVLSISKSGVGGSGLRVNGSNQVQLGSLAGGSHEAGIDLAVMGGDIGLDNAKSLVSDDAAGTRRDLLTLTASDNLRYGDSGWAAFTSHEWVTGGNVTASISESGSVISLTIGRADLEQGIITVTGAATGSAEGGELRLQTAADHDTTYGFWAIDVRLDDIRVFPNGGTVALIIDPTDNLTTINRTSAGNAQLDINQDNTALAKPVLMLTQADVSEEFIRFVGSAAVATLTQSIVAEADVTTATRQGFLKVYVQDDGNQITDQAYFVAIYTLA